MKITLNERNFPKVNTLWFYFIYKQTKLAHTIWHQDIGTGEMAQPAKCLLYKHEDLTSDPQQPCKKWGVLAQTCNPSLVQVETHTHVNTYKHVGMHTWHTYTHANIQIVRMDNRWPQGVSQLVDSFPRVHKVLCLIPALYKLLVVAHACHPRTCEEFKVILLCAIRNQDANQIILCWEAVDDSKLDEILEVGEFSISWSRGCYPGALPVKFHSTTHVCYIHFFLHVFFFFNKSFNMSSWCCGNWDRVFLLVYLLTFWYRLVQWHLTGSTLSKQRSCKWVLTPPLPAGELVRSFTWENASELKNCLMSGAKETCTWVSMESRTHGGWCLQ